MKVDFYHLSRRGQDAGLVSLVSKIFDAEKKALLICSDATEANRLDGLLWTEKPETFWAHGIAKGAGDAQQPLLISTAFTEANQPAFGVLFNLTAYPESFGQIERVLVPFNGDDPAILDATRKFYTTFKEAEVDLSYWKLENDKWVKKA